MRIGVKNLLPREQRTSFSQPLHDFFLSGAQLEALKIRPGFLVKIPIAGQDLQGRQVILLACDKVVFSVPRCRMHQSGAVGGGDIICQHQRRGPLIQRVLEHQIAEITAFECLDDFPSCKVCSGHGRPQPLTCD